MSVSVTALSANGGQAACLQHLPVTPCPTRSTALLLNTFAPATKAPSFGSDFAPFAARQCSTPRKVAKTRLRLPWAPSRTHTSPRPAFPCMTVVATRGCSSRNVYRHTPRIRHEWTRCDRAVASVRHRGSRTLGGTFNAMLRADDVLSLRLPSERCWPVTTTVGAFNTSAEQLASWMATSLSQSSPQWSVQKIAWNGLERFATEILSLARVGVSKVGILGVAGWSLVLNNASLGTDLGMVPSLCARELKQLALRLTRQQRQYEATILEVYSPDTDDPLRCRRVICAANDGGRWTFNEYGEAFPFEDLHAYRARRIRDRFTARPAQSGR